MKYFNIQLKRAARFFPYLLLITLVLFVGLALIFHAVLSADAQKLEKQSFRIAVSGDTENELLQMGMAAFQSLDETRFSISFIEMPEADAKKALSAGDISAYIVVPKGFVENAMAGKVTPITFVTTAAANDITTMFKNEITRMVTDMVVAAQKGSYGIYDALKGNGNSASANKHLSQVSIEYLVLVLDRHEMLAVEELGISNGLDTATYYVCSIAILFMMLVGIPFACLYCKKDAALTALLVSKGTSHLAQLLAEYVSHLLSLTALVAAVLGGAGIFSAVTETALFSVVRLLPLFFHILPVVMMLAAFNRMVFALASNVIGGILAHFFFTLSLCYVSGCFYPLYAFPPIVQNIARVLPVHVAREQMGAFFTGETTFAGTAPVLLYTTAFLAVTYLGKRWKTRKGGVRHAKVA